VSRAWLNIFVSFVRFGRLPKVGSLLIWLGGTDNEIAFGAGSFDVNPMALKERSHYPSRGGRKR